MRQRSKEHRADALATERWKNEASPGPGSEVAIE